MNGEDYAMLMSVQVEFQPLSKPNDRANISIAILADDEIESQESFRITLSSSNPLVSFANGLTFTTIVINDQSGEFQRLSLY